jgi:hypothetical protein
MKESYYNSLLFCGKLPSDPQISLVIVEVIVMALERVKELISVLLTMH